MQFDLIIFDCDGVLVDSEPIGTRVMISIIEEFGLSLDFDEALASFKGRKMADCVTLIEKRLGKAVPEDFVDTLRARTYAAFKEELRPVHGIEHALDRITISCCVASSGPTVKVRSSLALTGLLPRFDGHIFSSYEIGSWKPDPGLFLHAAQAMGATASRCAVIEDSVHGVRAGARAGMRVFGYAGNRSGAELAAEGAIVFGSMYQLPALLTR